MTEQSMADISEHDRGWNDGIHAAMDYHAELAISAALAGYNVGADIQNAMAADLAQLLIAPRRDSGGGGVKG